MRKQVHVLFAEGFEEIEAFTVVDILRRAGLSVVMVSCAKEKTVVGAHGIHTICDVMLKEEIHKDIFPDAVVLPGGMPGSELLAKNEDLKQYVLALYAQDKIVAAICAAPALAFSWWGILDGKKATCFPTML